MKLNLKFLAVVLCLVTSCSFSTSAFAQRSGTITDMTPAYDFESIYLDGNGEFVVSFDYTLSSTGQDYSYSEGIIFDYVKNGVGNRGSGFTIPATVTNGNTYSGSIFVSVPADCYSYGAVDCRIGQSIFDVTQDTPANALDAQITAFTYFTCTP